MAGKRTGPEGRGTRPPAQKSKPKPTPRPRTPSKTRATAQHRDVRSRLEKLESWAKHQLQSQARTAEAAARRAEARAVLEQVEHHRRFLAESPRSATPVGGVRSGEVEAPASLNLGRGDWRGTRWFSTGNQFLGYLEGRPNLHGILRYATTKAGASRPHSTVPDRVARRIRESALVQNAPREQRGNLQHWLEEVWDAADFDGAEVEEELDVPS